MDAIEANREGRPTVSVVIPFYQGLTWLEEAIRSVLDQTRAVDEVIVVNDGSPEDLSHFLEKYGALITYIETENGGPAAARNIGLQAVSCEYVAFLDSDDVWKVDKNEKQLAAMLDQGACWSHTGYELFDTESADRSTIRTVSIGTFDGNLFPRMMYSNPLATPSIMIRSALLKDDVSLRFGEGMRYGQDQYLWMMAALQHPILAIDEPLVRVRMRGQNAALRARVQLRARAQLYLKLKEARRSRCSELSLSSRFGFGWCVAGEKIVERAERGVASPVVAEWIARVLYAVPWALFKINAGRERRRAA
jgi:teichuronic acid biosynthesis glycosyltransferase TuaG